MIKRFYILLLAIVASVGMSWATTKSITINESSHGSVVASPTSAEAGETITLTATPDDGYQLKSISGVYVPVSETLNATSETVNGNKFQAQATSRNNNGWRVYNPGTANTLTVSSLNGTTLITKIEFTSTWGGQRKNNMLSVSAGTLSFDGNDPSTTVTINGINATSVTISGSGTNAGQTWCIKSVKVYYEGTEEEELEISDTENANVKTFTMVDSEVTISAEFEAVAPAPAATVTWNSSNISNLTVNGNSYSKEGVTLSPNASNNYAYWLDYGNESQNGIYFYVNATGGHTFSNSLGKNFTKIEMTLNGLDGWASANLGSGWNIDGMKAIWTGNASTVDLLKETSSFGGAAGVKSIVFYFEGGSEEPGGGSTPDPEPVVLPATKYAVCNVPDGWAVTANGDAVSPISGRYYIADGQTVVLTPTASMIDLVEVTSAEETGLLGSGTAEDPYLIYTVANWNAVAAKVNDGTQAAPNCRQMANLDGVTTVMGNSESKPFKGIYDGNGFVFSNVNLSITSGSNPLGLFGCVNAASAVVKNVVVAGGTVSSTSQNAGAIVGQLNGGTVQYCANYATVSSSYNGKVRVGGIVSLMRSAGGDNNRVDYCINYGNVSGKGFAGGIIGSYGAGYVNYCQNYGSISSSGTDDATSGSAGGIIGWDAADNATKITYNHNGGNITEAKGHGYKPSRYIIANTNSSDKTSLNVIVPNSNSYLSSLTLTIGSTNYTGAELATHEPNAQALDINPEGITISGITYAYGVAAPIAPAPGTNPGTDPAQQSNKTWQFTMPSHNIGLTVIIYPAEVIAKINNIPATIELKLATRDSIEGARAAYDALTADQQALVPAETLKKLTDAEEALAALNPGGGMPAGALSGKFTINAGGDQVSFAKGNLQATTTDLGEHWTWAFAANQWDNIWIDVANNKINGNGTVSENGTVDLFCWSTSGTYYGINNSGFSAKDVYQGDFVDWSTNMGAGWRTLTKDEWNYLIDNCTKGRAAVNGKNGYIFLPDEWSGPAFTANPDDFTTNTYDGDDWTAMENAGAVFLPYGPARNGTSALIAMDVKYWSSTSVDDDNSYVFTFYTNQSQSDCTSTRRYYGCMVRLVTAGGASPSPLDSAQAVKDLIEAIPVPVTLDDACVNAIHAAQDAYNALTEATKGALDAVTVNKLNQAIADYTALIQAGADAVTAKINNIPQPVTLKLATRDSIEGARAAYDALTADQKALVTNYAVLEAAEATLAGLNPGGGAPLPEGALTGAFSINADGDKIAFSKGNLQATTANLGETWTWAFAAHQYDYVGSAVANTAITGNKTVSTNGTIDLFGWSTAATYYGINNSNVSGKHPGDFIDWGETIAEGWRTLTRDEWNYLFETRTDAASKYGHATVAGIHGIIVLPDSYKGTAINADHSDWSNNTISAEDWAAYEANGVAFLPAAGSRLTTNVNYVGEYGMYWTSTTYGEKWAYRVRFLPNLSPDYGDRVPGHSVRLVTAHTGGVTPLDSAQAVKDLIDAIPVPVTLEDACVNAIEAARAAYDALSEAAQGALDDATLQKLTDAEDALTALNQAVADEVIAKINNIPLPVELKLATRDSIQNARTAYDALNAAQQALVSNYQTLLDAEAALAAINPGGGGAAEGALSGKFTINADGDQIAFAKGNLQATTTDLGENWTWGFAANQWEVIGNAAANNAVSGNKTVSTNGTVDLFGWSTPMTYYGIHNSTNADYYSDDFREWGENITGATWKTPSPDDWSYIIYDRADAADKQGPATVNGVNGYIFLPDEWVLPSGLSFTAKPNSWTANVYDGDDWTAMENAGAVFLPKSSWRKGNTVTALAYGYYWSSDYNNYSNATAYYFKEDLTITATGIPRYAGIYVRLVTAEAGSLSPLDSAQIVKDLIDAIPVPVTLSSKDAIDAARNAYDALAEATKGALDATTVQKLTDAEDAYAALIQAATDVIALINAIPQPVVYNEACGDSIAAAREAYDALSDELKAIVSNYNVLTDAEDTYAALAPRIWTSGDCQVLLWPGDSSMIVSKLPGEGNGVMDNYATKNDVPWKEYQLAVKTLTIESGVTEIGKCAFYDLRNLAGDLVIPEGVTAIHENGFRNCLKLTSITLPSTITLLGDNADSFNNCKAANVSITADPNKLAWNEDFDDFIYSYAQASVHKTTVCHVPADFYEIYVAKFDTTVNVTFVGDLPNALSEAEHQAIDAVKDSIDAIGAEISYPESGAAIDAARSAYDALDDDLKPFVSNYQTLLDAEDAYADAKQAHDAVAYAAIDKINAIPVPVEYSSKAAIDTARVAYDALLDTQKALVSEEVLQKLTDAEAAWAAIAEKVEHNVSYMGKDGELKNEIVALLNIPDPAPDFNGYEFVRWDVKAGDFLEEGLRIKAIYTPIITTNPQGFDTLAYNGLAQELVKAGVAKEGHIEYSLQPEEPESWSANLPKATNAGVYAIYYKLVREGHADYLAPEPTMATIAKVPVTYVAPIAYDTLVYNAANQTLAQAGTTTDGTFWYSLNPTDDNSWKTAVPQGYAAGSYGVYYKVQGDINHLDSTAVDPIAVTIAKAALTATADDKNVIYGDAVPAYTVTYAGWQGDDDATVLTGDIAFACEYAKGSPVGEYTITPSGVDAANYTITFVNGKVTVNRKSAKSDDITAKQADNEKLVYTAAVNKPTIQAKDTTKTLIEGTDYQLTFIGRGITEYAESVNAPIHVGEYTAIVDFIGNYKDTLTVDFVINKAPLTITADDKEVTFGEFAPQFTVSYEGFLGTDTATVLTGVQAYACEYERGNNVGEYTIIPSGVDAHDYAITFANGKLTVNRKSAKSADIAAKQADNEKLVYDAEVNRPTIQVKDTTLVLTEAQDYVLTFKGVGADQSTYAESETAPTHVGNYTAVVAFIGNYIDTLTVDFTINKAPLTITANDTAMIYGDIAPEFTVSYDGWFGNDDESVLLGTQAYDCIYAPGSPIGTYAITPKDVDAYDYAITFVDGTLTVNKAHVYVSDAEAQIAKFADGHANAVVLKQGTLNGIKVNDPIAHVTTAAFSSADVAENLTITLFYELTGDADLLNNYYLEPTSDIFTNEGVIIEPFIPDNEDKPEDEEATVNEGIEIYAYGYCDGSGYSLKYHLESGNPDQYKIDFEDSRFTDVDWTNLVITGKDGTIDIEIPVDLPTGDYTMTVYFRDSRFDWLESRQFNVTFHVNLPETYVRPLFDNVIALVDTCHCLTDIQWYWRANSTELWQPIEGANGYYYHVDGKLTGEYFVYAKMNGEPTYTCGQADMETLYGETQKASAPVVKAYPNPVVTTTTVTIENSTEWIHNIRIVNLMGAEVMNDTFEGDKTSVEMGNYPQGNYMISVDGIVVKVMKK